MAKSSGFASSAIKKFAAAAFALGLSCSLAHAQATRTWVSGVGDDANPCSRTAPCKTFAGAISKTAAGGEISVLDPGGFGAVTITKSISIISEGSEGSILAASVNGIIINAASTDFVHLEGLKIEGAGTGLNGIKVLKAKSVTIKNCTIRGFNSATAGNGNAIKVEPTGPGTQVHVSNCTLSKNVNGVQSKPAAGFFAQVHLDNVHAVQNTGAGILSDGTTSNVRMSGSTVTHNVNGLSVLNSGKIISFGDNRIINNVTDGAPTSTVALQ
jgi:hypothetical protein